MEGHSNQQFKVAQNKKNWYVGSMLVVTRFFKCIKYILSLCGCVGVIIWSQNYKKSLVNHIDTKAPYQPIQS